MILMNSKKRLLTCAVCIGAIALASIVALIGCGDDASPSVDTTPPDSVMINNVTAAVGSVSFEVVNPNNETVRVTVALTPAPPETARVVVDDASETVANTIISLTDGASKNIRITGLTNGVPYTVTLTTADSNSNVQQQTATGSATPLAAPVAPVLNVMPASGSVTLTWVAPAGGPEVGEYRYRIYRRDNGGEKPQFTSLNDELLSAGTLTYTDEGITDGTAYHYRVRAINTNGTEGDNSNTAEASPPHYYRLANGVTIVCTDAAAGGEGTFFTVDDTGNRVNTVYTKRTKAQITTGNAATSCTSGIISLSFLFPVASVGSFNEDISHWDTSSVQNMQNTFQDAVLFNQDIGHWDVAAVLNMRHLFNNAEKFNQDIGNWDTSNVMDMTFMFNDTDTFNQDISRWKVGAVTDMSSMFKDARMFNHDIGGWDVSEVSTRANMADMFNGATIFNQDLSGWCVTNISSIPDGFNASSALTNLPSWGNCPSS